MKSILFCAAAMLIVCCVFAQDYPTGLKFATPEQLLGIPMASTPYSGDELPSSLDLSTKMPPVGDQGRQSSCVGWAVAYAVKSYQEKIEENNNYISGGTLNKNAVFSPAFIYNQINNGTDGGSLFTDALNVLSQQGAPKLSVMPYSDQDYLTRPTAQQREEAKRYKIDFWRQVNIHDIKEVKAQVNAGYPVMIGASLDNGFVQNGRNAPDPYIWSSTSGGQVGGHAMVVVGYNDAYNAFKVINSWGTAWGNNGYCWIDYNLFRLVVREGYVAKDAVNGRQNIQPQPNDPPDIEPTSFLKANFTLNNVAHNINVNPWGLCMNMAGTVQLPKGVGKNYQIVIRFYLNDGVNGKGVPVGSLHAQFALPDATAATGTPFSPIPGAGAVLNWNAIMPYNALNIMRGTYNAWAQYMPYTTYLVAEPILYVDNFAVQYGQLVPFFVAL